MVNDAQECDRVFETALRHYPRDLMLAYDYGYFLNGQGRNEEAARMFQRCIGIRSNVSGVWKSLSVSLQKLGESEAAE